MKKLKNCVNIARTIHAMRENINKLLENYNKNLKIVRKLGDLWENCEKKSTPPPQI